jgi:putative two-component system response regulator
VRVKRYTDELESAESMIRTLTLALEARDRYTEGHSSRLAEYAIAVGRALDLDAPDLRSLGWGGYLHDIGKIAVPDAILRKEGPLTAAEYEVIKTHPAVGDHLCSEMHSLASVRPIVRHHHEKLDGSGYPDGLRGDRVPLLAQIVSVADAFDAITTDRPYRRARSADAAFAELWKDVDLGLRRADVVSTFVTVAGRLRGSSQGAA